MRQHAVRARHGSQYVRPLLPPPPPLPSFSLLPFTVTATLSLADTVSAACGSLKWKPPSENSIDFKLVLRFAPTPGKPKVPDFQTKPIFELHVWCGDDRGVPRYEFYDVMHVADDEWERSVCFFVPFCPRELTVRACARGK